MRLGFVCTNYNNSSFTRSAVASLHAGGRGADVRVVIVDNRSHADDIASLTALTREFAGVELLLNSDNLGYFPGLNVGIRHLRSSFPGVEHVAVGNNDLVFPPDFIDTIERHRDVLDTWAVVAPDLVTPAGVHQNPHVRYPISRVRRLIWDAYFLSYGAAVVVRRSARLANRYVTRPENAATNEQYKTPGPIEQGYGACYLLGPAFFRHFSQLCAPTFMMQEEFFLYEQLQTIGQLTYYDPRFVVQHHGHATTNELPSRRQWIIARDAHRVYKHYLAMPAAERRRLIADGSADRP